MATPRLPFRHKHLLLPRSKIYQYQWTRRRTTSCTCRQDKSNRHWKIIQNKNVLTYNTHGPCLDDPKLQCSNNLVFWSLLSLFNLPQRLDKPYLRLLLDLLKHLRIRPLFLCQNTLHHWQCPANSLEIMLFSHRPTISKQLSSMDERYLRLNPLTKFQSNAT